MNIESFIDNVTHGLGVFEVPLLLLFSKANIFKFSLDNGADFITRLPVFLSVN